jgi:hypothetical protein
MATALGRPPVVPSPNQSAFTELYAFERPTIALSPKAFVEELKELVRAHPIDMELAAALKYGTAAREHVVRWIRDYYHHQARRAGTAATIARRPRRGLFIAPAAREPEDGFLR